MRGGCSKVQLSHGPWAGEGSWGGPGEDCSWFGVAVAQHQNHAVTA